MWQSASGEGRNNSEALLSERKAVLNLIQSINQIAGHASQTGPIHAPGILHNSLADPANFLFNGAWQISRFGPIACKSCCEM
jgi:hypothetical protein